MPNLPSEPPLEEILHPVAGIALEQSANALTGTRAIGGVLLHRYIESTRDYQSWKTFGAFVVLAATDGEGFLSRAGRKLQGKDENKRRPLNSYGDHIADKILINGVMTAIARREMANGNIFYGRAVEAASLVTIARDTATTADRVVADFQKLDTRAQAPGKRKALLQYLVTGAALCPLTNNKIARGILGGAFLYTAKKSVTSGVSLHQTLSGQRQLKRNPRNVPPYTSLEPSLADRPAAVL